MGFAPWRWLYRLAYSRAQASRRALAPVRMLAERASALVLISVVAAQVQAPARVPEVHLPE